MTNSESIGHNSGVASVDDDAVASIIRRVEDRKRVAKEANDDVSEIYREARSTGQPVDAIKIVVKRREHERNGKAKKIEENDALADLVEAALARKGV